MPTIIDKQMLVKVLLSKRSTKKAKRKVYIHGGIQYTPSDFVSQRYRIIVSNYIELRNKKSIMVFGDLTESDFVSTLSILCDQLSVPCNQVFINLTHNSDNSFILGDCDE